MQRASTPFAYPPSTPPTATAPWLQLLSRLSNDVSPALADSLNDVRAQLESLAATLHQPLREDAYAEVVRTFHRGIRLIVDALPVRQASEALVRQTLAASFPGMAYLPGNPEMAAQFLWNQTALQAILMGALDDDLAVRLAPSALIGDASRPIPAVDPEQMATYSLAAIDTISRDAGVAETRQVLERLRVLLRLSWPKLGRMFGVADETVRVWANGERNIPEERIGAIRQAGAALDHLTRIFLPERLADVVRRGPAKGFNGKTALDWILDGRIGEVADHYEAAFMYQA